MKVKKIALVLLHSAVFLFVFVHIFAYGKKVFAIIGVLKVGTSSSSTTSGSFDFVGPTPGTSGSLPTGTPQYYVVVAYNGSPTPTPLVKSAPTKCDVGSGQNSCSLYWPCIAGVSTYRAYYGTSAAAVADGASPKYLSVDAPTTTVAHTADNGTAGTTIPSGNLPFSNLSPNGTLNVNTMACKVGIGIVPGTPTPAAQLEVVGHINLDGSSNISNSASPSSALHYATKAYADYRCSLKRKKI